jgi:hypothetical protein
MWIDLRPAKAEASRALLPGNAGREALLAAPDEISEAEFAVLVPVRIRLQRLRTEL